MRYRLRTLLYVVAFGPPVLAVIWTHREIDPKPFLGFVSDCAVGLRVIAVTVGPVLVAAYVCAKCVAAIEKR